MIRRYLLPVLVFILVTSSMQFAQNNTGQDTPLHQPNGPEVITNSPIDTFDETVEMKIYLSGGIETRYYFHSYEVSSGLDLDRASQELRNSMLWSDLIIKPGAGNNLVMSVVFNTTDQSQAETLGNEAINLLSDAPDTDFVIAGVDISSGPWNETASVVRLEGKVDYQFYLDLLVQSFGEFDQGIPHQFTFSPSPVVNLGLARDENNSIFNRQGYMIRDNVDSLSGVFSFDVASQLGVSSLEPNQQDNNLGIKINVPRDVSNFGITPNSNTTDRFVRIYNSTVDFKGTVEESKQIDYYFTGSIVDNPEFSFDFQFVPENLQNSEVLLADLNPYGFISKAYIGMGEANVFSNQVNDQFDTNSSWYDILQVKTTINTDLNDDGTLGIFHRMTVHVYVQESNRSLADDVAGWMETEFGTPLSFNGQQSEVIFNPHTSSHESVAVFSYLIDQFAPGANFNMTGKKLLMQTDAWTASDILSDLDFNGSNFRDYTITSTVLRHHQYPSLIVPEISVFWLGLEVFEDGTPASPQLPSGSSGNELTIKTMFGLSELNKSSGYKQLLVALQVPFSDTSGEPIFNPAESGTGYSVFGIAQQFFGFTRVSGVTSVPTRANAWVLHGDAPKVEINSGYTPLYDINITVPYEVLSTSEDVMKPIMASLGFEADQEFETSYLVDQVVSAVNGTVFGSQLHQISRFNGTEVLYPLITDYWGLFTTFNQTYTDIYNNAAIWDFRYGNSSITDISMDFTYNAFSTQSGNFYQTGTTTANNSLIWTSSKYNYTNGEIRDRGGPSLANFSDPYIWDTTQFADGTWTLNVTATDATGNTGTREVELTVDNYVTEGNPSLDVNEGSDISDGAYLREDGYLIIDTTADTAPIFDVGITFQGESVALQYNSTDGTYYWDLPFDEILTGTHAITVTVVDYSGGKTSMSLTFNVDKQEFPEIDHISPADNSEFVIGNNFTVSVLALDTDTSIEAELRINNSEVINMIKQNNTYFTFELNTSSLGTGDHEINITILDNDIFPKSVSVKFNISIIAQSTSTTTSDTTTSSTGSTRSQTTTDETTPQETTTDSDINILGLHIYLIYSLSAILLLSVMVKNRYYQKTKWKLNE